MGLGFRTQRRAKGGSQMRSRANTCLSTHGSLFALCTQDYILLSEYIRYVTCFELACSWDNRGSQASIAISYSAEPVYKVLIMLPRTKVLYGQQAQIHLLLNCIHLIPICSHCKELLDIFQFCIATMFLPCCSCY